MGATMGCGILGSERFFLAWSQSLPLKESLPPRALMLQLSSWGPGLLDRDRLVNHPVWGGARFISSLSEGERTLRWFALLWWRRFKSLGALGW
jgi:hypothetical protein